MGERTEHLLRELAALAEEVAAEEAPEEPRQALSTAQEKGG